MPTIKIVPMPGVSVPGPQGPQGVPGPAGPAGEPGSNVDLGYLTISSETDPLEGPITTLEAPGSITIQSPTAPGLVTIQSYLGLDVTSHPDNGGIYINGRDPGNKVVTFADLESGPKNWTAPNDALYQIFQAHGGVEVQVDYATPFFSPNVTTTSSYNAAQYVELVLDVETVSLILPIFNGVQYNRGMAIIDSNGNRHQVSSFNPVNEQVWGFYLTTPITLSTANNYGIEFSYGGQPVIWWDADILGLVSGGDEGKFRGAKIEYHAYSQDSGAMIGTIYIAHDSGDHNVTHIEVSSGANDIGTLSLWTRDQSDYSNERKLYAYRVDGESDTIKIHWTAQVYYGPEIYD